MNKVSILVGIIAIWFNIEFAATVPKFIDQNVASDLEAWLENESDEGYSWEMSGKYEGDIILTNDQQRNGMISENFRWPNKTLVYKFDADVDDEFKEKIIKTIQYFPEHSCIQVKKRTHEEDYVYVTSDDSGCHSHVGRTGGSQNLNLKDPGCTGVGTILHEFLHALGFRHMQSTHNRDDYVDILFNNIQDGKESNFQKYDSKTVSNYEEKYDLKSVMHYSEKAFSKNGKPTIQAKDGTSPLGNREGLTDIDRVKLLKMYEC